MSSTARTGDSHWVSLGEITVDSTHLLLTPPAKVAERSEELWEAALEKAEEEVGAGLGGLDSVILHLPAEGTYTVDVMRGVDGVVVRIRPT